MVSLLKRLQPFAIDLMLIDFAVLDLVMKERWRTWKDSKREIHFASYWVLLHQPSGVHQKSHCSFYITGSLYHPIFRPSVIINWANVLYIIECNSSSAMDGLGYFVTTKSLWTTWSTSIIQCQNGFQWKSMNIYRKPIVLGVNMMGFLAFLIDLPSPTTSLWSVLLLFPLPTTARPGSPRPARSPPTCQPLAVRPCSGIERDTCGRSLGDVDVPKPRVVPFRNWGKMCFCSLFKAAVFSYKTSSKSESLLKETPERKRIQPI